MDILQGFIDDAPDIEKISKKIREIHPDLHVSNQNRPPREERQRRIRNTVEEMVTNGEVSRSAADRFFGMMEKVSQVKRATDTISDNVTKARQYIPISNYRDAALGAAAGIALITLIRSLIR